MERRALAVPYSCVVEEHALRRAAEAQDVAQYLNSCRCGQETSTGGRRSYIMGRERHAFEDAVHSTNGAAVLIIQFVEAYVQVVADGRPSPRPRHGPLCRRARGVVRAHGVSREGQRQVEREGARRARDNSLVQRVDAYCVKCLHVEGVRSSGFPQRQDAVAARNW